MKTPKIRKIIKLRPRTFHYSASALKRLRCLILTWSPLGQVLYQRVLKKDDRPLLKKNNPRRVLEKLIEQRYPLYALADITVESDGGPHEQLVDTIINELGVLSALRRNRAAKHQRKAEL